MSRPNNSIGKIKLPGENTERPIVPYAIGVSNSNTYQAILPQLTKDATIALTSDIPTSYVVSSSYNSSTRKLTITPKTGAATEITFGSNAFSNTTIPTSYITNASVNGNILTITPNSGSVITYTPNFTDNDHYPTTFTWTNGTISGPTGRLTGNSGFTSVSFGSIPAASNTQSGIVTTANQDFSGEKSFNSAQTNFWGHILLGGDADSSDANKPSDKTGFGDLDAYYYNTGICLFDADNENNYKISFPGKSGTFALTDDLPQIIDLRS